VRSEGAKWPTAQRRRRPTPWLAQGNQGRGAREGGETGRPLSAGGECEGGRVRDVPHLSQVSRRAVFLTTSYDL
jgi:hypothetical protein